MIRFVDLETGNTFDGSDQYVFWFDNEQSINIIYSKPICFISDKRIINISIEKNDIFKLIDSTKINSKTKYHNINNLYVDNLESVGTAYNAYYVHIIYITCRTDHEGEYICNFYIDNESYKVGADFYGADESLYINLSNNGIEIPEGIQKAIYPVNVHEDNRDNIVLNRKWKELLSNYWDIIANKGSYKSLYNSLNWFEYGDMLRLCELWKYNNCGIKYEVQDLQSMLKDKYSESKNNFAKTTYIALYCSLNKIKKEGDKIIYDDEKNPVLEKIVHKWSDTDLALKMSMLGSFYETYFMPIHLDLIHSTIENITFANTTKLDISAIIDRTDYIYYHDDIKCNIKDGDIFYLDTVDCYVNPNTLFKQTQFESNKQDDFGNSLGSSNNQSPSFRYFISPDNIIGVDKSPNIHSEKDLKLYAAQLYSGSGVIIDFEIDIPLQANDFIKKEKVIINNKSITDYKILKDSKIKFSIFRPSIGNYTINLQFDSANGYVYTKKVNFVIKDTEHDDIRVYKVLHKSEDVIGRLNCFTNSGNINNYINTRVNWSDKYAKDKLNANVASQIGLPGNVYTNYIPVFKNEFIKIPALYKYRSDFNSDSEYRTHLENVIAGLDEVELDNKLQNSINNYKGVCTNHLLIFKCDVMKKPDAGEITTDFYYTDTNVYHGEGVWNSGSGYRLNRRLINVNLDSDFGDCYNIITTYYDRIFIWKGDDNPVNCDQLYMVCVSKKFGFNLDLLLYKIGKESIENLVYFKQSCMQSLITHNVVNQHTIIYRNDNVFVPCYHELEELNAEKIQDMEHFTVSDQDALCVRPTIEYSKSISEYSWEFINMSDPKRKSIKLKNSIMDPFIANATQSFLDPGYYSIKFRYKYGDKTNTITLDSAFKKV